MTGSENANSPDSLGVPDGASTPATHPGHHTLGRLFRGYDGGYYRCIWHHERMGYQMRCEVAAPSGPWPRYAVGDETNVSERAIGRTFHEADEDAPDA